MRCDVKVFWKWFTVRLQDNFPTPKSYAQEGEALDLSSLADDFVRYGVFPDKKGAFALLDRVDIDRNGKVSKREFVASMTAVNDNLEEIAILREFLFSLKSNIEKKKRHDKKISVSNKLHKMIKERKMTALYLSSQAKR